METLGKGCAGTHRTVCSLYSAPTCYEVVDDGIGAFICIHCPCDVPHHSAWQRVLRDREHLVLGTVPLPETPEERKAMSTEMALK